MDITIIDGDVFRQIFNCLKNLISDEGAVSFTKKGIIIKTIDTKSIILINVEISNKIYQIVKLEDNIKLFFSFDDFYNMIKLSDDDIKLKHSTNENSLVIKMTNKNKKMNFKLPLNDIEKEDYEDIDIDYKYFISIDINEFNDIIKNVGLFSKKCKIKVKNQIVYFYTGDKDMGGYEIEDVEIDFPENEKEMDFGNYSIGMLSVFSKISNSGKVIIKFLDNVSPACFQYVIKGKDSVSSANFYLAQMVD